MGVRGPKPVNNKTLLFFAELYYQNFKALADGLLVDEIDKERYEKQMHKLSKLKLSYGDRSQIEEDIEKEIGAGGLAAVNRRETVRDVETIRLFEKASRMREQLTASDATLSITKPARPSILRALLAATEPEEVRKICRTAFKRVRAEIGPGISDYVTVANWPIEDASQFPFYLSKYAEQFLSAKKEKKFPAASHRPSSRDDKQLWFFACALAGAVHGIATRTAVNLLGSRRRKRVTVPAPAYSLWERGELDFPEELQRAIKKLGEQIDGGEIYADVIAKVRRTHPF